MGHKQHIPQAPVRTPINRLDPEFNMDPEWIRWLNQVSFFSYNLVEYEPTLDPATVSANTTEEQSFTVSGIKSNDVPICVLKPSHDAGLGIVNYRIDTDDQIKITFMNATGSGIDPPSETYYILTLKR